MTCRPRHTNGMGILVLSLTLCAGCGQTTFTTSGFGEDVVAEAYGEVLTWDSLAQRVPDALSLEDSAAFAERLIDRWMREQVMLAQADAQLKEERTSLNAALEAYRKSLLINTYETRYVESRLDTDVNDREVLAYYEDHAELFTLHDHAVRVLYMHLPDPESSAIALGAPWTKRDTRAWDKEVDQLKAWLTAADSVSIPLLERWCMEHGAVHHVDHEAWWRIAELLDEVPLSLYRVEDQIQRTSPLTFTAEGRVYFRAVSGAWPEREGRAAGCGQRPNRRTRASRSTPTHAGRAARHALSASVGGGETAS